MSTLRPLMAGWRLHGSLPEHMIPADTGPSFTLPGAQALAAFSGLLGDTPDARQPADERDQGVPLPLPSLIPEDVPGEAALSREIDFGALRGDYAVLTFDALCGRGDILLDGKRLASFDSARPAMPFSPLTAAPCALALDLTDALRLGRRQTLSLRFDGARPAGVPGVVMLRVARHACFRDVCLVPNAAQRTVAVRARIAAEREGAYALRVQTSADDDPALCAAASLWLSAGHTRTLDLTVSLPGDIFQPGKPYAASSMKIQLWRKPDTAHPAPGPSLRTRRPFWRGMLKKTEAPRRVKGSRGALCDSVTLLCGYPGEAVRACLPLTPAECAAEPRALLDRLTSLHIPGVFLPVPASDALYRALTRTGIGVRQRVLGDEALKAHLSRLPCVTFEETPAAAEAPSPITSAWQMSGVIGQRRTIDPSLTPAELLFEAAGRAVDPQDAGVQGILGWLRAVHVRMLAEAARQRRYAGMLCAPGEWVQPDIADALRTAFAPVHLSALPLCGAWWTGSQFSASLCAFVAPDLPRSAPMRAEASLEDEEGICLARVEADCPKSGGDIGLIRAALPDTPCVLTLTTRLICGETVLEESTLPVYAGQRGPLEAAFTG